MNLEQLISNTRFNSILEKDLQKSNYYAFDFTEKNNELKALDMNNRDQFEAYINDKIHATNSDFGLGKYAENRILYRRFNLFETGDPRSFHLGIDIWKEAGTEILAPIAGEIHSFRDNDTVGDYGPTIILKHSLENFTFYTLYGHLSKASLKNKKTGDRVERGENFCSLGDWSVNVNWPPHLHFQIIKDIKEKEGDFPGVCEYEEREKWMQNCPDPNLILQIPGL